MSIEGQGHFFTIYFPGFVCFVLYLAKISGERLQDHWSSGNKGTDQLRGNHAADQCLCFCYTDSTILLFALNPKFQSYNHLLWLYSPVCVGPGRKPPKQVFSRCGSSTESCPSSQSSPTHCSVLLLITETSLYKSYPRFAPII